MGADVDRVAAMEERLDECVAACEAMKKQLERFRAQLDGMKTLFSYYGSEEWYLDRDGDIPAGIKAGVLSEDAVYDALTEVRDLSFEMLETATDILKNRI